jgi:hypothetical protein
MSSKVLAAKKRFVCDLQTCYANQKKTGKGSAGVALRAAVLLLVSV